MAGLYVNETLLQSIFLTFVVGCGCAWQAGASIAQTWRPLWTAIGAMILLGFGVRFLHFALFEEPLFEPAAHAFETICLIIVATIAWRFTRARQMTRQYYWLYELSGPLGWRLRQDGTPKDR
jgi:hypothetical protein